MGERDQLLDLVRRAGRIVVFTGAGISTECGIPDFRSPGGFWTRHAPITFDRFLVSSEARREAWARKFSMEATFGAARPGPSHRTVARMVELGRVDAVITQNIDNMHQAAGIAAEKVIELHGNGSYAACLECGRRHELDEIRGHFEREGEAPDCGACGGLVKTATISFGQAMPREAMELAGAASLACDLMLVLGSSLVVHPAASIPLHARRNGARLVILNREPTPLDGAADLVIHGELADLLAPLAAFN